MSILVEASRCPAPRRLLFSATLAHLCLQDALAARILISEHKSSLVNNHRYPSTRDSEGTSHATSSYSNAVGIAGSGSVAETGNAEAKFSRRPSLDKSAAAPIAFDVSNCSRTLLDDVYAAPQRVAFFLRTLGSTVNSLQGSSFVDLAQTTWSKEFRLDKYSVAFVFVTGIIPLLSVFFCCSWFEFLSMRASRERHQHFFKGRVIYEWDQTPNEATIYIKPPAGLSKDDLEISIQSQTIRVGRKGRGAFLRDQLYEQIDEKASSWTLRGGELRIRLVKVEMLNWPVVCCHQNQKSCTGSSTSSSS